jgi:hypothetical protein
LQNLKFLFDMIQEFYIISFIFLSLNIFLAVRLNVISLVLNYKHILNNTINVKLSFGATLIGNYCKQHCNVNINKLN